MTVSGNDKYCYLGIGSNLGDRRANIEKALQLISAAQDIHVKKVSSLGEYPALVKAETDFRANVLPFLNIVAQIEFNGNCLTLLAILQKIEKEIGKAKSEDKAFNPRCIDIDILLFKNESIQTESLVVPHYDLLNRNFFLDLLCQLDSSVVVAGNEIIHWKRKLKNQTYSCMEIFNANNNSFSADGLFDEGGKINAENLKRRIQESYNERAAIIDIGAISTAPKNETIIYTAEEEIEIITETLNLVNSEFALSPYSYTLPKISIDTFRYEVMKNLIDGGYKFDILNDQSGLDDPLKLELLKDADCDILIMHSSGLPVKADSYHKCADLDIFLDEIKTYFKDKISQCIKYGIPRSRIIIDPGIGFGKSGVQSVYLLKNVDFFSDLNVRFAIGHSRKRFLKAIFQDWHESENLIKMNELDGGESLLKDFESSLISCCLGGEAVEYLRVHNLKFAKAAKWCFLSLK